VPRRVYRPFRAADPRGDRRARHEVEAFVKMVEVAEAGTARL
jgi:hypothetical protein